MKSKWLFLIILLLLSFFLLADQSYVLMVSFDGFRYDYMEKTETPNLDYVRDHGVKAESMQPIFPSKTFPNHYAIATGSYAGTHHLMANSFYNPKFDDFYAIGDASKVTDGKWYKAEPIWVTAERQGVTSASYFWVGSEADITGIKPSIVKEYDHDFPYEARIDSVMSWFQLPEEKRPQLVLLYFDEPDSDGHRLGPENPELHKTIQYMDGILGKILQGIEKLPIGDKINLILVSDHGMTTVGKRQSINITPYIPALDNVRQFFGGPVTQLHLIDDSSEKVEEAFAALKELPRITTYRFQDIPERFHYKNDITGDLLLVAQEGWVISGEPDNYPSNGTHGYDPAVKNMHGIFYAMGPDIKENYSIGSFENVHVYPLICELLGIEPYKDAPDAPDGRLEVLEEILRR